jgi:hypothetical protein
MEKSTRISICATNQLFDQATKDVVDKAVERGGQAFEAALFLQKLYLKRLFETVQALHEHFHHGVAEEMSKRIDLSSNHFSHLLSVVSNENVAGKKTGAPFSDKSLRSIRLLDKLYVFHANSKHLPTKRIDGSNLSHCFKYMAVQMKTVYATNVHCHFDKYIKRIVRHRIRQLFVGFADCSTTWELSTDQRKELQTIINKVIKNVLYDGPFLEVCQPVVFLSQSKRS